MKTNKIAKNIRLGVLVTLLIWVTYESYMHQILGGGKSPSIHALCPYGALESLYSIILNGGYIKKIFDGTVVLLTLTLVIALIFRRSFCGLLCPFGALQELFARLGKFIFKKTFLVPSSIDKPLRYLKYFMIPLTLGMAWYTGTLWMSPYDPYAAYGHITSISGTLAEEPAAIVGFIILAITLLGSIIYDRFFCKYLCPAGAFYGIVGKFSPTKIVRTDDKCTHCKICNSSCPVNIDVEKSFVITDMECISCNECVNSCPSKGALEIKTAGKSIKPLIILVVVLVIFFGGIFVAQSMGVYNLTNVSAEKIIETGEEVTVADLKGYYTIEEAAQLLNVELKDFYKMLGVPESIPKNTQLKSIGDYAPDFEFGEFKGEEVLD